MTRTGPSYDLLEAQAREAAVSLREIALHIDRAPYDTTVYRDHPGMQFARACTLPGSHERTCVEHAVVTMTLAEGDAGAVLAAPGASLAGLVADILGSPEQQAALYSLAAEPTSHTFCAITEPRHGSDAMGIESTLTKVDGGYLLRGAKRYVGNASRGVGGVVFARTGPAPASIRAVLVRSDADGARSWPIETTGLRGARIGALELEEVFVPDADVLGGHLPAMRRGIWGAIQAFNIMRVQVAALAVGTSRGVARYVAQHAPGTPGLAAVEAELVGQQKLILRGAAQCDADPTVSELSSLAKLSAVRTALRVTEWSVTALGSDTLYDHPLLEKWWRDVRGFEFMEGVSNVQRLHLATGFERSVVRA